MDGNMVAGAAAPTPEHTPRGGTAAAGGPDDGAVQSAGGAADPHAAPRIGIALSGGGSRAIAFHLGCLRTLDRAGILRRAAVLSTVSGGSVIGAMYAVHDGDFAGFEDKVRAVLASGLLRPSLRTAFTTTEGLRALSCLGVQGAAWLLGLPARAAGRLTGSKAEPAGPPRRYASRTTILRRTMDDLLFGGRKLSDLDARAPRLVMVACELRTGSAFYFGRRAAGSWRLGAIDPGTVTVAQAVVASAAYPLALPALDVDMTFTKRDRSVRVERVTLSDGGVYDNLGLAPLWPDRDRDISVGVEKVDFIVACRAGYGLRVGRPALFVKARMGAAFASVFSRAQNAAMGRLFDLKAARAIEGFAIPYIDQADERLAFRPDDLVPRTAVADYPTNFDAMPADWVDRLAKRGEQVTLATLREHLPQLLPAHWRASESHGEDDAIGARA